MLRLVVISMTDEKRKEREKLFQEGENLEKKAIERIKKMPPKGGKFGTQLIKKALYKYKEAAKEGHIQAMCKIVYLYETILKDEPESKKKAIYWKMEEHFAKGKECFRNEDYSTALEWYKKAAEAGHSEAMKKLAYMYEKGQGIEKSLEEAKKWLEEVIRKNDKDNEAKYRLYMILKDLGDKSERAWELLKKAAEAGHNEALYTVVKKYYDDYEESGNYNHLEQALKYLEKSEETVNIRSIKRKVEEVQFKYLEKKYNEKNINSDELRRLAELLKNKGNWDEAKKCSEKANFIEQKDLADNKGKAEAMYNVAERFLEGKGIEKNEKESLNYLKKAIKSKNSNSELKLKANKKIGEIYEAKGEYAKALKYYEQAARCEIAVNKNICDTMMKVASMYEHGQGVDKSAEKALEWYKKAADKGNVDAMMEVASMYEEGYENGQEIVKSDKEALEWYKKAANNGDPSVIIRIRDKYFEIGKQHREKAMSSYKLEKFKEAEDYLKKAKDNFKIAKDNFKIAKHCNVQHVDMIHKKIEINKKLKEIENIEYQIKGHLDFVRGKQDFEKAMSSYKSKKYEEAKKNFKIAENLFEEAKKYNVQNVEEYLKEIGKNFFEMGKQCLEDAKSNYKSKKYKEAKENLEIAEISFEEAKKYNVQNVEEYSDEIRNKKKEIGEKIQEQYKNAIIIHGD